MTESNDPIADFKRAASANLRARLPNDFGYHPATSETGPMHDKTRTAFLEMAEFIVDTTPISREQSLALTALQEAAMWTNAAIACNLAPLKTD